MNTRTAQEAAELVRTAQSSINEAIDALQTYCDITGDHSITRTLIATLQVAAGREHEWLDRSVNCDDVLDSIDDATEYDPDDDSIIPTWKDTNPFC